MLNVWALFLVLQKVKVTSLSALIQPANLVPVAPAPQHRAVPGEPELETVTRQAYLS